MAAPSVDDLARSFERYLRAGNKSPRTIETYLEAVAGFTGLLSATSRRSLDEARREDVEAWIGALLAGWQPATAHNRYRGLHAFYRWLEDEEDIPSCGSPATCWRRLTEWTQAGVFDALHLTVLDQLGMAGRLDWSRASVDTMSVRARRGGPRGRKSRRSWQAWEQAAPGLRRQRAAADRGRHGRQRRGRDHAGGRGR
jgi:hypothetical protein